MEIQLVMRLERDGGDFEWGVGGCLSALLQKYSCGFLKDSSSWAGGVTERRGDWSDVTTRELLFLLTL